MRTLSLNLIVAGLLLFGATSASAFAINMTARGATSSLVTSNTVTVDVFLDADPGLTFLGINVIASNDASIDYDAAASAAAAASGGAGPGAQPTYILYTAGKASTVLYPQQTPAFLNWPAPPVGAEQVNVNYAEPAFGSASASGTGIWIATLVFHINTALTSTESIALSLTAGGGILQTGATVVAPSAVALSAPILLTVPEPTSAALLVLGIGGLLVAGRRRSA
jgi:hypothetical protein